jgi:dTDP-4-dehydrorhamnose reductase
MVWLIGNKGMLGTEIEIMLQKSGIPYIASDREIDITDIEALKGFVQDKPIKRIINASAYTAVDKAESEPELAMKINGDGVANIAKVAKHKNAALIHFSTDYVFDGTASSPYTESIPTNPQSAYGKSKLAGENHIREITDKFFIIRIAWLYGIYGNNFVKTMVRLMNERNGLNVVSDQRGTPTYTKFLSENIVSLLKSDTDKYGIYHYTDSGEISWFDFAKAIYKQGRNLELIHNEVSINPISTSQYPTPAKRPAYSVLSKDKIKRELGFDIHKWEEGLADFLQNMKE